MALSFSYDSNHGITHEDAYVRVYDARVDSRTDGTRVLRVHYFIYHNKEARAAEKSPVSQGWNDFDVTEGFEDIDTNIIAFSYDKLKTLDVFSGAEDV